MTRALAALLILAALALTGCPQPPVPHPQPPDASDAAPATGDALPPTTPCQAACAALAAAGCAQGSAPDCVQTLAHVDGSRLVRTPSGAPLTCAKLSAIRSAADANALGVGCGP